LPMKTELMSGPQKFQIQHTERMSATSDKVRLGASLAGFRGFWES